MSVKVVVRNGNIEGAISAFKKRVQNAGILEEYKEKQFYTKPSVKKRAARKAARRKQQLQSKNGK